MDNKELCIKHSEDLAIIKTEIKSMHDEIIEIKIDVKDGNDKVFNLLTDTLKQKDSDTRKDKDFYFKILWASIAILGTVTLAYFGIKQLLL